MTQSEIQEVLNLSPSQAENVFNLLTDSGLLWSVNKLPLYGPDGQGTRSAGIFRADTGNWMGTVGVNYEPLQNSELAEIIVKASEGAKVDFSRGGSLADGNKVFLQAKLADEYIGRSNVKRWLTALNSHDGSASVAFGTQNTVVVCQNTWYQAHRQLEKFRHTATIKDRLHAATQQMRAALDLDYEMVINYKRMAETQLRDEMIKAVIERIFSVDVDTKPDEISTRKENQIQSFALGLEKEVQDQGKTLWALFNGVTRYTNHTAAPTEPEARKNYLMQGSGYRLANIGFDECLKWIDENTAEMAHL